MKSGNMFGKLRKYKESTYFYKHRIITFDSLYEDGQYAVFSVLELNTVPGTAHWYDLWSLNSNSYAEREEAIRELERRSAVSSTLDVQADEQLLLLVTCLDGENERLVVAARRLREGETADTLTIRH
jgi:sortase B